MKQTVNCSWTGDMAFEAEVSGHKITMDADASVGGRDLGPRPKPMLLSALAGCTGMDVISILKKMRINPGYFDLDVDATLSEEHPKTYSSIHLVYKFRESDNLPREKVETAVGLSQEKYCGVSAMLRAAGDLTYEIAYI